MVKLRKSGFQKWFMAALAFAVSAPAMAGGPYQFYPVSPCRVVDTRNPNGVNGGPAITVNQLRGTRIQGNCGVPVGAKAVSVNITVVTPGEAGWLGVYPVTGFSGTSAINFNNGEFAIANGAIVPISPVSLATDMDSSVLWGNYTSNVTQTHVLLDVTGYFQ